MKRKAVVLIVAFALFVWIGHGNSIAEVTTKIYWTDWGTGSIQRANLDGTEREDIATGFAGVRGITVDNSNDKMYWIDNRTGSIQRGNLDGTDREDIITGLESPSGVALDVSNGKLYWSDAGTDSIQRSNLDGTDREDITTGLENPSGVALDVSNGKLYWSDVSAGSIQRANLDGTRREAIATGLESPSGVALDVSNGKMYWADILGGKIQRANLDGTRREDIATDLENPLDVTLDVSNGKLYWADFGTGSVQRANLDGTRKEDIATDLLSPTGVALFVPETSIPQPDTEITNTRQPDLVIVEYLLTGGFQKFNVISEATLPPSQNFTLGLGVENQGQAQAASSTLRYYLSNDDIISSSDTEVETQTLPALNANLVSYETAILTAPTVPGVYYYGMCVAPVPNESNTDNNCSTAIKITVEAPVVQTIVSVPIYWTDWGTGSIQRVNLDGTNAQDLVTGLSSPGVIALDVAGGKMYWTDSGKIQCSNLDGSGIEDLVRGLSDPQGIALDVAGGKMYWTDRDTGKIQRSNLDGSGIEDLVRGLSFPGDIALDVAGGKMYWTTWAWLSPKIQRANLNGSNVQDLITNEGVVSSLDNIALDIEKGKIYWADGGTIRRANLDGTNVEDIVTGLGEPNGIALDVTGGSQEPVVEPRDADVNGDGIVDLQDTTLVTANLGQTGENDADVNGDGVVDVEDLVLVLAVIEVAGGAPALHTRVQNLFTAEEVQQWLIEVRALSNKSSAHRRGILMLEQLLAFLTPKETALLPNYPNPFNPETWIPYQLAKDADVTLHIYAVNGTLVRTLALGHKAAGMYQNHSRAAYWDGKNEVGESVASGVYFYRLTAGGFSATRRMLIMK